MRLLVGSAGPVTVVETTKPTKPCDNYFSNTIESANTKFIKVLDMPVESCVHIYKCPN